MRRAAKARSMHKHTTTWISCGAMVLATLVFSTHGQPRLAAQAADASPTPVPPLTIYPRLGNQQESKVHPRGPGLLLMGGGPTVDSSFVWMHDTIAGKHGVTGGDIVVLTASEADVYTDYLMKVAPFKLPRSTVRSKP
jgi:hypothetical protein